MQFPDRSHLACLLATALASVALLCTTPVSAAPFQAQVRSVSVVKPTRAPIDRSIRLVGSVLPWQRANLRARVTGFVQDVLVMTGDQIEKGQLLCTLDLPGLQADWEVASALVSEAEAAEAGSHAAVAEAEADVNDARARSDVARSGIAVGLAAERVAQTNLALTQVVLNRQRKLFQGQATTQEIVDEAQGHFDSAEATLQAAGADVTMAQAMARATQARIEAAVARVNSAEAAVAAAKAAVLTALGRLDAARTQLDFGQLHSPFDSARVTKRHVDPGALATAGLTDLLELQDLSRVRLAVQVPEGQVRQIKAGTRAVITLNDDGERIEAAVSRTAGALASSTRTMSVEIDLDNSAGRLFPGMFFHANLSLETLDNAMLLPGSAIHSERRSNYVLVVEAGQLVRKDVQLGIDDGISVQILDGLQGTEQVVRSNVAGLRAGDKVSAVPGQQH
jgi:RND family efflux transporter MFP subunit